MSDGFESAARVLPLALRQAAFAMDMPRRLAVEEFRLRAGREPTVLLPEGEKVFCAGKRVRQSDLLSVMELATSASMHAAMPELKRGYISARGGVRIGVCGAPVMDSEKGGMRDLSSLCIRVPRQIPSAGEEIAGEITDTCRSVLIVSPPGGGKTTLLRELVRISSNMGRRVSLADERGEVAAVWEGEAQFDVGRCTDVLSGAPKAFAAMLLLRAMSPEIIALDEITSPEDIDALASISNCGVKIYATAHAYSVEELSGRPLYRKMLELGVFERAVQIFGSGAQRRYRAVEL